MASSTRLLSLDMIVYNRMRVSEAHTCRIQVGLGGYSYHSVVFTKQVRKTLAEQIFGYAPVGADGLAST